VGKIVFACAREIGAQQDIKMAFVTHIARASILHHRSVRAWHRRPEGSEAKKGVYAPAREQLPVLARYTSARRQSGKLIKRANTPLPKPLLISLHPDSTFKDVDYLAEQALKFTSLSWRSTLARGHACTIFYSERIAELLGRLKDVPDWSSAPLSVRLKWSRWFL